MRTPYVRDRQPTIPKRRVPFGRMSPLGKKAWPSLSSVTTVNGTLALEWRKSIPWLLVPSCNATPVVISDPTDAKEDEEGDDSAPLDSHSADAIFSADQPSVQLLLPLRLCPAYKQGSSAAAETWMRFPITESMPGRAQEE